MNKSLRKTTHRMLFSNIRCFKFIYKYWYWWRTTVIQEELIKTNRVKPSPQTLTCLLEKVLRLNNFTFNDEHFIQIKGTAMGTRVAPNFANVYMGRLDRVVQLRYNLGMVHSWHFLNMERGHRLLNGIHWPPEQRSTVNQIHTQNIH